MGMIVHATKARDRVSYGVERITGQEELGAGPLCKGHAGRPGRAVVDRVQEFLPIGQQRDEFMPFQR